MTSNLVTLNQRYMQTRYLYFCILTSFLLVNSACSMKGKVLEQTNPSSTLLISALTSKTKIKVGEPIEINCLIANIGNRVVTIRPDLYGFADDYVRFFDADQMEMDRGFVEYPEFKLNRESYIELSPDEEIALRFNAVVSGPNIPELPIPLLSFIVKIEKSVIHLRGGYSYSTRCQFQQDEDELETSKRFGIKNLWLGRIISDPIEFTIEE